MRSDLSDVDVIYQTETESAVCVNAYEGSPDVWIMKRDCEFAHRDGADTPVRRRSIVTLTAPERVLIEKGLV